MFRTLLCVALVGAALTLPGPAAALAPSTGTARTPTAKTAKPTAPKPKASKPTAAKPKTSKPTAAKAAKRSKPPPKRPAKRAPAPVSHSKPAGSHRSARTGAHPAPYTPINGADKTPAYRYGQLTQKECEAQLSARGIGFVRETASGVRAPVRLKGRLHGVAFRTDEADSVRPSSPHEVGDCRLLLALDDWAITLAAHDIVEVRHFSMWRPPPKKQSVLGEATRHPGALAIDVGRLIKADATQLVVDRDFNGAIDAPTCGDSAKPHPATPPALELRALVCDAVAQRLFNVVLTPNYNRAHHNHFHLELTTGVRWFLVH